MELMPDIVGDETVGEKYACNGLLFLTLDGAPILGETPRCRTSPPPPCGSKRVPA